MNGEATTGRAGALGWVVPYEESLNSIFLESVREVRGKGDSITSVEGSPQEDWQRG